jgi:hypothetical protein
MIVDYDCTPVKKHFAPGVPVPDPAAAGYELRRQTSLSQLTEKVN